MSSDARGPGRDGDGSRGGGILWALGLSVVLHFLIVLLSLWVPLDSLSSSVPPPEDETTVTFRFDAPPPAAPPQPQPEPPAPQPDPEPLLRPEPAEGVGPLTETPGTPPEPADEALNEPGETTVDESVPPTTERVEPLQRIPDASRQRRPRRLDVERALREFEDALRERDSTLDSEASRESAPRNRFRPAAPSLSNTFGMGNLVFESGDYDWTDYARQILTILERAVNRRIYVTLDEFERWAHERGTYVIRPDQRVYVRFVIERSGEIVGIQLTYGSRVEPFDAAVLEGLEEAILPQLPDDFPRDREVVHIEALFPRGAPILQLRPSYRRLKAMGWFSPDYS